jgi:hypothetical protein
VVIMSTDSPHVPLAWIAEGFALLDQHDVVLGPCTDGGYYLVGMRAPHDIFSAIQMSTPTVLAETQALAEHLGLRTALLPETFERGRPAAHQYAAGRGQPVSDTAYTAMTIRNIGARLVVQRVGRKGRRPLPGAQIATIACLQATTRGEGGQDGRRDDTASGTDDR